jgi:DNA-binding transcriptional ArsR family regulator
MKITNLQIQYFIWESYDQEGNVNETGQGNIYSALDNTYILDFNTKERRVGEYLLIVILDKDNYVYKNAMILLSINKRNFNYILSDNFQNKQTNVVQGVPVHLGLNLTDPTQNNFPVFDATVELIISGNTYEFLYNGNGTYTLNYQTNTIDAFFASTTLTGIIRISRNNYNTIEVSITIVVEMQQILPGIPTFYFLLILAAIIALVGSIAGYRIHQNATIPTFVKKARSMKKSIKGEKTIADSLLYRDKEVFIGERIKNEWDKLGLSLEEIFGITLDKDKKKKVLKKRILQVSKEHDNKPLGLILMKWDERIGTEIKVKYPSEINISEKTLMQIYSIHEYSGEKGVITLTAEATNIVSYYTGSEEGYYMLLLLNLDDDPDVYEGGIADTLRILLENLEDDSYMRLMPSLFQRLSLYPSLNREQLLAVTYQNNVKRAIINLLREEGVIIKSELLIWLKDKHVHGFLDLEAILSELIKLDILKVSSIKDIPSELVFLTNDIFVVRFPPHKLLGKIKSYGLPPQFTKEYYKDVRMFFQTYNPTEEDSIKIAEVLSNPQAYETLRLLRNAIVTREDLTKLQKKGVSDFYSVLKTLWDNKMIKVFHDEKNVEYYALLTDFYIDFIFPKYLLKAVKSAYEQKSKVKRALIEYLNILEDGYLKLKSSKKNK